ncbi:DUF664 domain-containing protein [Glycomyces sp. NPDC048151]|uniref:mycothiol transferase n=1 Tax=Glycomyces sp. NPDC048151 TaxID=3364002 RepID=UPI003723E58D
MHTEPDRAALARRLQIQRTHILGILEGLDEEALRAPAAPSGWSCLDLVHHLALDVERFWFRAVMGGEPAAVDSFAVDGGAWTTPPGLTATEVFDLYRREAALGDAAVAERPLASGPAWWPDRYGPWRLRDLREVMLHVITETACHAGQLDIVREHRDGRQWLVLD